MQEMHASLPSCDRQKSTDHTEDTVCPTRERERERETTRVLCSGLMSSTMPPHAVFVAFIH